MAKSVRIDGVMPFDCTGDTTSVGPRWRRWKMAFQFYIDGTGITDPRQKKALLLHSAGMDVQEVYSTLEEPVSGSKDEIDEYEKAMKTLDSHFTPQTNVPFERHEFRQMFQGESETVDQFVIRLTRQSDNCEFGENKKEHIRDQVIDKCRSNKLRRKLLEMGKTLTLDDVQRVARSMEASEMQARRMESDQRVEVNSIASRKWKGKKGENIYNSKQGQKCYRCGKIGHFARDKNCPAVGKTCKKCNKIGHFAVVCKTQSSRGNGQQSKYSGVKQISTEVESKVNDQINDDNEYAFVVGTKDKYTVNASAVVDLVVGGVNMRNVMIDSGASCNVVDRQTWEDLKEQGIKCESRKESRKLYPYGSIVPLDTLGVFKSKVQCDGVEAEAEFIVIAGRGQTLLGRETALQLGVLSLGPQANVVVSSMADQFPECFQGLGKLKNYQAKIHINPDVRPVAQNPRRIPFSLRSKVEAKVDELLRLDVIEKVNGPTPWVSPVCVVPKPNGDVRLCVDMRKANKAVVRERHPIPTVDEILQDMNESAVFSKLDLKWGYHQVELDEDSREITTFATHTGLYRYKRLMFGITAAPELYQHIIQQVLQGCEGVHNISDDIIVHGRSLEEHDRRLNKVFERLREKGLTLNPDKCQFRISRIVFMGHVLSEKGIAPMEDKVKAILEAREPTTVSEVRSFLGLVTFCSRFIPDLATIAEPLRRVTRKNTAFLWGEEQERAFKQVKEKLGDAETLAYFDGNAVTQIITDASPVGLGAVLIQEQKGKHRVIAYASRSLSDVERRYSQTEKEALAIVWACERFHLYLYGISFEILTDHKPLEVIYSSHSQPSARIERWVLRLQPYDFTVKYVPGPQNIADTLSRLVQTTKETSRNVAEEYVRNVAMYAVPIAVPIKEMEKESGDDEELTQIRQCIQNNEWNSSPPAYKAVRTELCVVGKLVLRGVRIVVPRKLRRRVLDLAHEGHQGMVKSKQRLRSKVWWPGIDGEMERRCKTCPGCQLVSNPCLPEPVKRTKLPDRPWQMLAVDLLGPLPSGHYLLVLVDYFSRFVEVAIMKSVTSKLVVRELEQFFAVHGNPESLKTDNGPQFVSEEFGAFLKENDIFHLTSTPLWPQANGEIERQNRSLIKALKIAQIEKKDWQRELLKYLLAYRSTPHSTTGVSPSKLLFGREIRTKLPELREESVRPELVEVQDRDSEMKQKGADYVDLRRRAQKCGIQPGDKVLIKEKKKDKLSPTFCETPLEVVEKRGNEVIVKSSTGVQYRRNVTHVKKFEEESVGVEEDVQNQEMVQEQEVLEAERRSQENSKESTVNVSNRPQRVRRAPERFKDYVCSYVSYNFR